MSEGLPDIYVKFEGIDGECMDEKHRRWFQIKSFNFNFSVKDTGDSEAVAEPKAGEKKKDAAKPKPKAAKEDKGPHSYPDVSLSKALDATSTAIWQNKCYGGQVIAKVECEACRTGGVAGEPKIPFVRLVFEEVYVKSVAMSISEDSLPSETLQFSYERARMEAYWTDNETGKRRIDRPRQFGWDFHNNKQWVA